MKAYFDTHPCLNLSAVEKAAGIPAKDLRRHLSGARDMSAEKLAKVKAVIVNYGFVPIVGQVLQSGPTLGQTIESVPIVGQGEKSGPSSGQTPKASKKDEDAPKNFTFTLCINIWFEWHKKEKGEKPHFSKVDGAAIKMIITALEGKAKDKGADITPKSISEAFAWLLDRVKQDAWMFANADLKTINSKFNILITKKNGTATANISDDQLIAEAKRIANAC